MPNWCDNHLTIYVPTAKRQALEDALKGPGDWPVPESNRDPFQRHQPSAHEEVQIFAKDEQRFAQAGGKDALIAAFKAEQQIHQRPNWMPVTRHELRAFWERTYGDNPTPLKTDIVPFSVAKLAPWKDKAEFDAFFPGVVDEHDFWKEDPAHQSAFNAGNLGYIKLRHDRIGVKWPPSNVIVQDDEDDTDGHSLIYITFSTPWGPMSTFNELVFDVLAAHDAQAILVWKEEDSNSGWFYVNPAEETAEEHTFEHGSHQITTSDPDDPEYEMSEWDDESLLNSIELDLPFTPRIS